ncbi:MAG: fatty acid desaturase, partial [Phycisphaerales bacterium]|nr:fatty acid desaturase [Phycisphaerales bacterium]
VMSDSPLNVGAELLPESSTSRGAMLRMRIINLVAVLLPFAGLVAAIVLLWGPAFNWLYLALLVGMYLSTAVGITVGYHRLFTHRSFRTPRPVAAVLAALGSMAVEGPLLHWVATHRKHHQHSDDHDDPHSPHGHAEGVIGFIQGLWHAHMGWIFRANTTGLSRYVRDFRNDRLVRWMSGLFPLWVLVGLLVPAAIGGLVTGTWMGVLLGFIWGGLVRIFLVHHVTWSINSVCHLWGSRPYRSHDESRNNAIFGVLALGEGWHNNHHAFPTSARHGLRWWQIDMSYMFIRGLGLVGLARDIRVPTRARMESKRRDVPPGRHDATKSHDASS